MKARETSSVAWIVTIPLLALAWFFLAPPQLGGSTLYSSTVGTSMEPLFHAGDLAVVRPASSYRVGEIVLYESPVLHRPVLHRIYRVQNGRYYFKGDNNDFVDVGYATRKDLLGRLWFRIPEAGRILGWLGKPLHSALVAALASLALLVGGAAQSPALRRRPGSRPAGPAMSAPPRLDLRSLRLNALAATGVALLVAALAALAVGLTTASTRTVQASAYSSDGTFSYQGELSKADSALYPTGSVSTGSPLFLNLVDRAVFGFAYRFRSALPHQVRGTLLLEATLSDSGSGWQHVYTLGAASFLGDRAQLSGTLDLSRMTALITQLEAQTGSAGASYSFELAPIVHLSGLVGGKPITQTFTPTLPFSASQAVLKLNVSAPAALPGASYAPPSTASVLAGALHPAQAGTLPRRVANTLSLGGLRLTEQALLVLGALLAAWGAVALALGLRRGVPAAASDASLAARYGRELVEVCSLEVPEGAVTTDVPSLEALAKLARQSERPILHAQHPRADVFAVDDLPRFYRYERALQAPAAAPLLALPAGRELREVIGSRRVRRLALLTAALAAVAGATAAFTSANTVPATHAGVSHQALALSQLEPSQCASLTPTKLIVASGPMTNGDGSNDLILGRNATGMQTLKAGNGAQVCLVGGGGAGTTNKFQGGTGDDVCVGAPAATNDFTGCTTTYN